MEGGVTRKLEVGFHYCRRRRHSSATWMLSARSLSRRLLRNKKGMRPACRMGVLETPRGLWGGKEE